MRALPPEPPDDCGDRPTQAPRLCARLSFPTERELADDYIEHARRLRRMVARRDAALLRFDSPSFDSPTELESPDPDAVRHGPRDEGFPVAPHLGRLPR